MNDTFPRCESAAPNRSHVAVGAVAGALAGSIVMLVMCVAGLIALSQYAPPKRSAAQKARHQIARKLEVVPIDAKSELKEKEESKVDRVRPLFPDEKGIRE